MVVRLLKCAPVLITIFVEGPAPLFFMVYETDLGADTKQLTLVGTLAVTATAGVALLMLIPLTPVLDWQRLPEKSKPATPYVVTMLHCKMVTFSTRVTVSPLHKIPSTPN